MDFVLIVVHTVVAYHGYTCIVRFCNNTTAQCAVDIHVLQCIQGYCACGKNFFVDVFEHNDTRLRRRTCGHPSVCVTTNWNHGCR